MELLLLISNLTEAGVLMAAGLILFLVTSNETSGAHYYRRAKLWMSLSVFMTGASFLSEQIVGGYIGLFTDEYGGRLEMLNIFNLIFFFIISISGMLALVHLYNSERLTTRTLAWLFTPVALLIATYAALVATLEPRPEPYSLGQLLEQFPSSPLLIVRMLILFTTLATVAVTIFRYFQARRAYQAMLNNYFSDDELRRSKWIDWIFYCALLLVSSTVTAYLLNSAWYDLFFTLLVVASVIFLVVRFVNYQNQFLLIAPAVEFARDSPPLVDQQTDVSDSVARMLVEQWLQRPDKPYLTPGLTLNDVVRMMGLSKRRLSIYLNSELGVNFHGWINTLRIREVERLLLDRSCMKTLSEIAFQTGFADLAAMSGVFKKTKGVSPSIFRSSSAMQTLK